MVLAGFKLSAVWQDQTCALIPGGSAEELGAYEVRSLPDFTVPAFWLQSSCTPCQQELIEMS